MYEKLIFTMGHWFTQCEAVWPDPILPYPAIFMADYARGLIDAATFQLWMAQAGPEYSALAECLITLPH